MFILDYQFYRKLNAGLNTKLFKDGGILLGRMIKFNELLDMDPPPKKESTKLYKKQKEQKPWVEKYRPKKLDDVIYQIEVIKMLKNSVETGNLPHLLLYGPPGTGKTSTILAIAMELFGPRKFRERVIELNASDERGINVVRNKIIQFARSANCNPDKRYPSPSFKIIILDEADAMTTEAQSALRKTMEDNSNITRFCIICNYINQIIDPIISRCVKLRFKSIKSSSITTKLRTIADIENVKIEDSALDIIANQSDGDMRSAIMLLQNLSYVKKQDAKINIDDVYLVSGHLGPDILGKIERVCIKSKTTNINSIVKLVDEIKSKSYPIQNVIGQICDMVVYSDALDDQQKSKIGLHISRTEKRLLDGAYEYLQLLSVLMCIKSVVLNINSKYNLYVS